MSDHQPNPTMTINGHGVTSSQVIEVINPATGEVFATAPDCSREQLDAAVETAQQAWESWRRTPVAERQAAVRGVARVLRDHADELARLFTAEQGRPLKAARQEITGAADWLVQGGAAQQRR